MDDKPLWKTFIFAGAVVFLAGGLTVLAQAAGVFGWLLVVLGGITLHAGLIGAAVAGPLQTRRGGRGDPHRATEVPDQRTS